MVHGNPRRDIIVYNCMCDGVYENYEIFKYVKIELRFVYVCVNFVESEELHVVVWTNNPGRINSQVFFSIKGIGM